MNTNPYFPFAIVIAFVLLGAVLIAVRSDAPQTPNSGAASARPVADNPDADPILNAKACPFRTHGSHLCN